MAISPDRVRVTRRMTRQFLEKSSAEANDGVEVIEISSDEDGDEDGDVLEDDPIKVFIVDNDDEEALAVFSVYEDTSDNDYESDDSGWSGKS